MLLRLFSNEKQSFIVEVEEPFRKQILSNSTDNEKDSVADSSWALLFAEGFRAHLLKADSLMLRQCIVWDE